LLKEANRSNQKRNPLKKQVCTIGLKIWRSKGWKFEEASLHDRDENFHSEFWVEEICQKGNFVEDSDRKLILKAL
jgi:hypothetical protein